TVLGLAIAIFVASLSLFGVIGTEFVPEEDRGEFQVLVDLPPGTSFDESVAQVSRIEQILGQVPEVRQVFSTIGLQGEVRSSSVQVKLSRKETRARGLQAIKVAVRKQLASFPFAEIRVA